MTFCSVLIMTFLYDINQENEEFASKGLQISVKTKKQFMGAAGLVGAQTGVVRQHNKIKSSHYLGNFAIEKYDCTHWNCRDCGVARFFHPECKILTCKPDALVKVATYRDKPRGKG
jgi:hypothetical protein